MRTIETDDHITEAIVETMRNRPEHSFYVLHESRLRRQARQLADGFLPQWPGRRLAYAVKANPLPRILDILIEEGVAAFDCASLREIELVRQLDVGAEVMFNNPVKKRGDIVRASRLGVRHFTVQSEAEFAKLRDCLGAAAIEVAVRFAVSNPYATINLSEKFGARPDQVRSLLAQVAGQPGASPGVCFHVGSQCRDARAFADAVLMAADLADGIDLGFVNLGGGLPVNYGQDDRYRLETYLATINAAVHKNLLPRLPGDAKIYIEPGRAVVAEAVYLAAPVLAVEQREQRCVYIDEGIWSSFINVALFHWPYRFDVVGRGLRRLDGERQPATLFGRTCDSTDALGEVALPRDIAEGDVLVFHDFGAYRGALATSFNGFDAPRYLSLP